MKPQSVGSHMVVNEKKNPDWVWKLKGVVRPTEKKTAFYCRVFDEAQAATAGVKVKDWSSLDEHPEWCALRSLQSLPIPLIKAYWKWERWEAR
jgi:hypothetical protein